jgi:DNA (cytosine-5)-methyltransferase 1
MHNVVATRLDHQSARLDVFTDTSAERTAQMKLLIGKSQLPLLPSLEEQFLLEVNLFGSSAKAIQTMWNAVDDWVIRSSSFHSLFELYGHFTEPHPIFWIETFEVNSREPIFAFAKHISCFANCSRYFPREHLLGMFGRHFGATTFTDLVKQLRHSRFDIRCKETNVAIPDDVYMVCYPFTLPFRRQMNFSVKNLPVQFEANEALVL